MQDGLEISNAFTIIVVSKLCYAELLGKFAEPGFGIISSKSLLKVNYCWYFHSDDHEHWSKNMCEIIEPIC